MKKFILTLAATAAIASLASAQVAAVTANPNTGVHVAPSNYFAANQSAIESALQSTTVGRAVLRLTNPGAITFLRINADNSVSALSASDFRAAVGLAIGTNVQAWDADLDTWATKTAPSGTVVGTSDTQALTAKTYEGLTITTTNGTLTIANGKTLTSSNSLTVTGTDGSTINIGTGGTLGTAAYTAATAYEVPLTFSTGLARSGNTITLGTNGTLDLGNYTLTLPADVTRLGSSISLSSEVTGTLPWSSVGSTPTTLAGYGIGDAVPSARAISTTAPLSGGGNLTSNLTLSVGNATTSDTGVVELATDAETQTGTDTARPVPVSALAAWWTWVKTQAQTFTGNLTVQGSTNLGDASGDAHVFRGSMTAQDATAVAANNVANVGALDARYKVKYSAVKTSATSRNATTTLAADPHLTIPSVQPGSYVMRLQMSVYDNSGGGFNWAIGGTATFASQGRAVLTGDLSQFSFNVVAGLTLPLSGQSIAAWPNSTRTSIVTFAFSVSVAGSVELQWSQNTSSATNINLNQNSYMIIEQL
jgi:hypothetical protein